MKKILITGLLAILVWGTINAQGYKIGDTAANFKLKNVDGKMVSLFDYNEDTKGAIIIFTCNHCPYAKAYESRIIDLNKEFRSEGYPVIAINPNDPELVPEDSFEKMVERAKEMNYTFPYLIDSKQEVYKIYGAVRTPHVFVLKKKGDKFIVSYIGTIDDNYKDPSMVNKKYVESAVMALLNGQRPSPDYTKAIGCSIKDKKNK